ncbi:MAG: hypothetical protein HKN73_07345, partial [Gemmatimonadetes bacterium]|nr:hypothetical protein [Gemmatimonadota bacterium]
FEVLLDPNLDQRTGYRFRTTAGNVQTDRYLFDDGGEDAAWDAVWESAVTVDDRGWIAEFRIPFSQMRYETSDDPQTWGIQIGRRRAADNELTRFSLESKLRPGRVSQFGRLTGLQLTRSPARLELRPFVLSSLQKGPAEAGDPFFDGTDQGGQAGLDMRYGIGTSFTLDATINPDFGQVELDPAVINLTAFETFLDERRPFFVEDARVFDFSLSGERNSLFYTRRIGRPPSGGAPDDVDFLDIPDATSILGAAKITGRTTGGLSVGGLVAVTGKEDGRGYDADADDLSTFDVEPRTQYGVLRLRQDLRDGHSSVGIIGTFLNRSLPGSGTFDGLTSSAFNGGLDFEHTWSDRAWALFGFLAGSHVRGDPAAITAIQRASNHYLQRPDLEWSGLDSTRTALTGAEWRLQFERRSGSWTGALWAAQVTSGFEVNDLGFSRSTERLDGGARVGFQDVSPGRFFRFYSLNLFTFHNWSHEALRDPWSPDSWGRGHTAGTVALNGNGQLNNFWRVRGSMGYRPRTMSRTLTRGGARMESPGSASMSIGFSTDNRARVQISPSASWQRGAGDPSFSDRYSLGLSLQPSTKVQLSFEPRYERDRTSSQYVTTSDAIPFGATFGDRYIFADLEQTTASMVTRLNWTLTTKLSLELFAQPLLSAGDYITYKQLSAPETFAFDRFDEGPVDASGLGCTTGRSCLTSEGDRLLDFDADGLADLSFADRDFNVRSLRANAVLRWEYRPGSTLFFVWQRRQAESVQDGRFDLGRDLDALWGLEPENVFILKANLWLAR